MPRTTGAPRARSRKSSRSSSAVAVSAGRRIVFCRSVSRIVANAASMSSAVATTIASDCRNATSAARIVSSSDRPRNRQRQRPGRMLIGKEVLLLEKARRELRASEEAAHQVPSLHAITTIESGKFVGKARRSEFRQNPPNRHRQAHRDGAPSCRRQRQGDHATRPCGRDGHEIALQHSQEPVGMARLLEDFTSLSRRNRTRNSGFTPETSAARQCSLRCVGCVVEWTVPYREL